MARSLNSEEAAVFNDDALVTEKSPSMGDFAQALLERQEYELEFSPELAFWLHGRFPGS